MRFDEGFCCWYALVSFGVAIQEIPSRIFLWRWLSILIDDADYLCICSTRQWRYRQTCCWLFWCHRRCPTGLSVAHYMLFQTYFVLFCVVLAIIALIKMAHTDLPWFVQIIAYSGNEDGKKFFLDGEITLEKVKVNIKISMIYQNSSVIVPLRYIFWNCVFEEVMLIRITVS